MIKRRLLPAVLAGALSLVAGGVVPRSGPHPYARAGEQRSANDQTPRGEGDRVPPTLGPHDYFRGRPWRGNPGVTERLETILARSASLPPPTGVRVAGRDFGEEGPPHRMDWPSAPAVASWPFAGEGVAAGAPLADVASIATSWLGIDLQADSQWVPPDSNGSVGPTQVVVTANGRFKAFDKTGALLAFNVVDSAFFPSSVTAGATQVSDPHVRYDRTSQRWFITEITVPSSGANRIVIAVSSGPDVVSGSWTFFGFEQDLVGTTPNIDTGNFADYDTLGVDAHALYIGVNMFNGSLTAYEGTTGFVVNKADLLAGTLTVTPFRGLASSTGAGPYTPQGVQNDDPASTEGYFIGPDNASYSLLQIRRITSPGGTPSISGNLTISVPTTSAPLSQPSSGTSHSLDAIDDRLFAAEITKNVISGADSLWTAHNIAVTSGGVGASSGSGRRDGARWYQLDNLTSTPTLTQSGTVYDSSSSNPLGYWMPSVAANGQGQMVLSSSVASSATYAGIYATSRLRTDPLGTTGTGATFGGVGPYNVQSTTPQRWGDFSQVSIDPTDDQTFWAFEEYADSSSGNSWGVRVLKLQAPPPATPMSASPSQVAPGQASVNVTITGSQTAGSAFFDPGPGFSNHLAAAIGNGVTVNSVTFVNDTTMTVNISTVGATNGTPLVTITNPDGQTASGYPLSIGTSGTYTIAVSASPPAGGTVGGGGTFSAGSPQTVTATANSGYAFVNWTESGTQVSTSASYTFTLSGNRTLVANFVPTYTIAVSASPSAGGTVGGGGTFASGSSRTVTATANGGYAFVNWTESGTQVSTSASYTFTLSGNRTLVANFVPTYTIAVSASPSAGGTVGGGGTFASGTQQTVTATANGGYAFVNWTESGTQVSTSASYTFTLSGNRTLVANFTPTYTISVSASPSGGGNVTGNGTFASGTQQTVTATANSGYAFVNWTESGTQVSTSASYTFTLSGNRTLVANFVPIYTIAVSASPSAGGTVGGGGTFASGSSRTVTATANGGYTFVNWTESGTQVSTSASYTFALSGNRTLVANFTVNAVSFGTSPAALQFGATKAGGGGALLAVTPAQTVTVTFSGAPGAWSAVADQTWLQVTNGSGTGNGQFTVGIVNPGNVLGGSTQVTGHVTVSAGASQTVLTVTLQIDLTGTGAPPYGSWDTPTDGTTGVTGSIAVTGWALDDVAVNRVEIWRNCVSALDGPLGACQAAYPGGPANQVFIGDADFVPGARPDVAAAFPNAPQNYLAAWGYLLLTNFLPDLVQNTEEGGQGTFTLSAYAIDEEGHYTSLGTKTITLDNENAQTPFGAIDTPGQGGTIPGPSAPYNDPNSYPIFGWAMTQAGKCMVPASTQVLIDGTSVPLTPGVNWVTGLDRSDLSAAFPGLCDSHKALAVYYFNASALGLSSGLHTLVWVVTDDQGKVNGIGSRFFTLVTGAGGSEEIHFLDRPVR